MYNGRSYRLRIVVISGCSISKHGPYTAWQLRVGLPVAARNMTYHRRPLSNLGRFPDNWAAKMSPSDRRVYPRILRARLAEQWRKSYWMTTCQILVTLDTGTHRSNSGCNLASRRHILECHEWLPCPELYLSYKSSGEWWVRGSVSPGKIRHLVAWHIDPQYRRLLADAYWLTKRP